MDNLFDRRLLILVRAHTKLIDRIGHSPPSIELTYCRPWSQLLRPCAANRGPEDFLALSQLIQLIFVMMTLALDSLGLRSESLHVLICHTANCRRGKDILKILDNVFFND